MGTTPKAHAGRSAELQRLLADAESAASSVPPRPGARTAPADAPTPPSGPSAVSGRASTSQSNRSPLRSSPPTTFPRRLRPTVAGTAVSGGAVAGTAVSRGAVAGAAGRRAAGPGTAGPADGPAQRRATPKADQSARLGRSALVRSQLGRAGARALRSDHRADAAGAPGRLRGAPGPTEATRASRATSDRTAVPARKIAAPRSFAGRSGSAATSYPQWPHRTAVPAHSLPPTAEVRLPVAQREAGSATALPPIVRPRQRRTLVLAGGVAAAVVAIVAIVSLGNRGGSDPAAGVAPEPEKVAMVQSTGADGKPTMTTVTAPVSTVNGRAVALVPDADGQIRQLTVVTATPPAVTARTSPAAPATSASGPGGQPAGGAAATPTASPTPSTSPTESASPTVSTSSASATSTSESPTGTAANPAPADPGDVATVVTGLTKLTGWVPVTTG